MRNPQGRSRIVLLCEHASNFIPSDYNGLGLNPADLDRHIAWDIGAADLTRALSKRLDATAILGTYSRLLIDLNRPLNSNDSIVRRSEATDIPANGKLFQAEIQRRQNLIFKPYHQRVTEHLDIRASHDLPTVLVSIHSFTPVFHGQVREWEAGVLFLGAEPLGMAVVEKLTASGLKVGANVPYQTNRDEDYAIPIHGDDRGIPAIMIEVRQDLLSAESIILEMADKIESALRKPGLTL